MRCPCTEPALCFCSRGTLLINANEYWARFYMKMNIRVLEYSFRLKASQVY